MIFKKKILFLQASELDGFRNLTLLSVDQAIPKFVSGTVRVPLNDNRSVSNTSMKH